MVPGIEIKDQIVGNLLGPLESRLGSIQEKLLAAAQVCLQNINWGIFLVVSLADSNRHLYYIQDILLTLLISMIKIKVSQDLKFRTFNI